MPELFFKTPANTMTYEKYPYKACGQFDSFIEVTLEFLIVSS